MSANWSASPTGEFAIPLGEFAAWPTGFADPATSLAARQAELVAALVTGTSDPAGFDGARLDATRAALLRKRAGEAAKHWPLLAASLGPDWAPTFAQVHAGHPSLGPLCDGWDVARALRDRGELTPGAAGELDDAESRLFYDGQGLPRPHRGPRRWFGRR
ncbi:hypothetical protein [Pseudonocardia sp. 73-21]|uniref:hypothetical protein n=1 Tax=Pseudonocardia sp. 73-21 TaxID=1895809 RepID=UPI00096594D3|nr:hypothetical protein [Pseudonocardia sp. 73-21]OJY42181.1 MAG: hypothetical protein BGP03_09925 [Pseudonocardia sp. 73-21]